MELAPVLKRKFTDDDGMPLAGGKLYTYAAGTTTPKATYQDRDGDAAHTNPIVLDANGECAQIWLDEGGYKFKLDDANDVELWIEDDITTLDEARLASAFYRDVVYITDADSPYVVSQSDNGKLISASPASGAITISLAQISALTLPFNIAIQTTSIANNVTINRGGTDTIGSSGATSKVLSTTNAACHFIAETEPAPDNWSVIDMGTVADGGVTTAKLADANVTREKLAAGAVASKALRSVTTTDSATSAYDI
jgi:hypothetical protein